MKGEEIAQFTLSHLGCKPHSKGERERSSPVSHRGEAHWEISDD